MWSLRDHSTEWQAQVHYSKHVYPDTFSCTHAHTLTVTHHLMPPLANRLVILQPMKGQPKLWEIPKKQAQTAAMALKDPISQVTPIVWSQYPRAPPVTAASKAAQAAGAGGKGGVGSKGQGQQGKGQGAQSKTQSGVDGAGVEAGSEVAGSAKHELPDTVDAAEKRVRALRKKLRQVEELKVGASCSAGVLTEVSRSTSLVQPYSGYCCRAVSCLPQPWNHVKDGVWYIVCCTKLFLHYAPTNFESVQHLCRSWSTISGIHSIHLHTPLHYSASMVVLMPGALPRPVALVLCWSLSRWPRWPVRTGCWLSCSCWRSTCSHLGWLGASEQPGLSK